MAKKNARPVAATMQRPKAARKPARSSARKSIDFPIDKLPAELVHMICVYLKPTELANLRLVSRLAAPIALQYMVPEVHLILAKDSFEQLKALAEHPIASKYVTSFFFEAEKLGVLPREHWEKLVAGPHYVLQVEELSMRGHPCHHATERSLRNFKRELSRLHATPRHRYSKAKMDHAFETYRDSTHFQQDLQEVAVQEKEVAEAMKHFPLLKELTMSIQFCTRSWTPRLRKTFEPTFCTYYEAVSPRDTKSEPLGVQQMRSLLLGAYHAGLKVETLQCGVVSWWTLKQDDETFALMKESVSNVKNLGLEFAAGHAGYDDYGLVENDIPDDVESCFSYLQGGRLRDFVTAAPALEHLQIGFQFHVPTWPTHLKNIVGEHHWPSLKTVKLKMIGTSEDDLVSFCSRHASTLKSLYLANMGMTQGDWFSAFTRMRNILTLDRMEVAGFLAGFHETLSFEEGSEDYIPELKEGIEAYFWGGTCSSEKISLDDFLEGYLPDTDDMWPEVASSDDWE